MRRFEAAISRAAGQGQPKLFLIVTSALQNSTRKREASTCPLREEYEWGASSTKQEIQNLRIEQIMLLNTRLSGRYMSSFAFTSALHLTKIRSISRLPTSGVGRVPYRNTRLKKCKDHIEELNHIVHSENVHIRSVAIVFFLVHTIGIRDNMIGKERGDAIERCT